MAYPLPEGELTVLHVEDNPLDAELCASALRAEWPLTQIVRVQSAEEMSVALRKHQFHLVLSDMTMPDFNGLLALQMLRECDPSTPFIFLSGTIGEDNAVQTLHDGATDYVLKDRSAKLVPAIKRALGEVRAQHDRRESARQLHEHAEYLAKARDAIIVTDLDRRITFWNGAAERILGYTSREALGKRCDEFFPAADQPTILQARNEAAKKENWAGELELHAKDGRAVVLDITVTTIRDDAGAPKAYLSISTDITEKRQLQQQTLQAQRVESIGVLAGGIAHDLNNVLTPILMSAALMQVKVVDPQILRFVEIIHKSASRGAELIKQVLVFARGENGEKTEMAVKPVAEEVVSLLQQTLPRSISIELSVDDTLPRIKGDPTQLSQVLMNLAVNARDAMPEGGKLAIRIDAADLTETQARPHSEMKAGRYVRIKVADTGCGIPPEVKDRIFDPFFTTKETGKGTGLGLSTALGIVRNHGGALELESEVGRGTEFRIYLPALDEPGLGAMMEQAVSLPRGNEQQVLVVDDEVSIRELLVATLEAYGYGVVVAKDAAEALELYAVRPQDFAVVITDMMMPGMQGEELIRRLREVNPAVRIVAMTGVTMLREGLPEQPGRMKFLMKPMGVPVILQAVAEMCGAANQDRR